MHKKEKEKNVLLQPPLAPDLQYAASTGPRGHGGAAGGAKRQGLLFHLYVTLLVCSAADVSLKAPVLACVIVGVFVTMFLQVAVFPRGLFPALSLPYSFQGQLVE